MKRTLAAVAAVLCACSRERQPAEPAKATPLFVEAAAQTGLNFTHHPAPSGKFYMPEIMGSGGALLDYDNDGDLDVFLIQAKPLDAGAPPPQGITLGNRLFRNELAPTGKLAFRDVTGESGLGRVMYGMGATTGDYDNDGYVDLYVTAFGANALYHNNGPGKDGVFTFTDVTGISGTQDERWSTSASFVDYDLDGDLDLFVLNYIDFSPTNNKKCSAPSGEPDYCTPKTYRPVPARLFRNDGGHRFTDVSLASGISSAFGPGLGIACSDFNGDHWPDCFVANDTAANLLWINRKNGTFAEQGLAAGAAYSEDGLVKAGMGVAAADYDADGDEDLFVVNLTREGATLFAGDGRGGFQDVSLRLGLRPATFSFTGFGTDWFDYDNDGWLDLFVANGAVTLMESLRGRPWPFHQTNLLLRNEAGKRYVDVSAQAGAAFELAEVSRGAAFGDIDNDGDTDILVTNNNGPARLLLNQASAPWIAVQLEGTSANRMALGAQVGLERAGMPTLWRRVHTDGSYLSASDARVLFGLGGKASADAIVVRWPGGAQERWTNVAPGKLARLRQGTGQRSP